MEYDMSQEWQNLAVEMARLRVERMDVMTLLREIEGCTFDAEAKQLATMALAKMGEES
jgi:hypothetical protein